MDTIANRLETEKVLGLHILSGTCAYQDLLRKRGMQVILLKHSYNDAVDDTLHFYFILLYAGCIGVDCRVEAQDGEPLQTWRLALQCM
jgi:hypothetical protein